MEDPRPFDEVATDMIDSAADKVRWNRKQADKLLRKADQIEEQAAITAEKFREAAASLIMEAQSYADNISDILTAEYPMTGFVGEDEDE